MTKQTKTQRDYRDGEFETLKFADRRESYYANLQEMLKMGYSSEDYLHYFPAFVGHMTLGRYFTLYEFYKKTQGLCGHIAEVGVYKGAASLLFAKLVQLHESEALTMVHGFDWFKGAHASSEDKLIEEGCYAEDEARLRKLVTLQKMDHILKIHNLDVSRELCGFFQEHPHLQFRLIYLDAGMYPVVSAAIREFWPRLIPGGIMVFDQFNHEVAPGETRAVRELLPDIKVETLPNSWMPNAYVVKPFQS